MIEHILVSFQNGYGYIRKHPELIMTLVLVLVVPVAFLLSGQQFLKAAIENQERLEKDRLGMLHDVFESFMRATSFDPMLMEEELLRIAGRNTDIAMMEVAKEEGEHLVIVASLMEERAGQSPEDPVAFRVANAYPGETVITPAQVGGDRHWKSYRLIRSAEGSEYYLFVDTSLVYIDSLFAARIREAYLWLFGILAVVLLLIIRHVRLIDYAYLYKKSKEESEMKDMFTNMIAHELRAPLTAMRGYASMIVERKSAEEESRGDAKKILESAARLITVVNDLLDVARMHSGRLAIKPERTNIGETIRSAIDTMQGAAGEKNISLKTESIPPNVYAVIDAKRFHQAMVNLVSNAIKYTDAGSITVSLEERKDRIEIRVKDTGMGISAENQKSLFAPFFRVKTDEVERVVGTGLGMWITKQLIELMKGSIGVESIRGVGTHVVLTFPK